MANDPIQAKLDAIDWEYGDKDQVAIAELTKRIEKKGHSFGQISYSDLVRGVEFHFLNINNGKP